MTAFKIFYRINDNGRMVIERIESKGVPIFAISIKREMTFYKDCETKYDNCGKQNIISKGDWYKQKELDCLFIEMEALTHTTMKEIYHKSGEIECCFELEDLED